MSERSDEDELFLKAEEGFYDRLALNQDLRDLAESEDPAKEGRSAPMSERPDREIQLRLLKDDETEVICDQQGRILAGVVSFAYTSEMEGLDQVCHLTIVVRQPKLGWGPQGPRAVPLR